jgi:hypothetical protein
MRRDIGAVVFALIASLGMCVASGSGARGDSHLPLMHAVLSGLDRGEWSYSGEVIATSNQGRFCAGLLCAHGIGKVWTEDGEWEYSGTFRYGDIVGLGHWKDDDDNGYDGFARSSAYPGGPPSLCGEPKGAATMWGSGYPEEVPDSRSPCSNGFCESEILRCVKDWAFKASLGQAVSQDEARRANRWRDKIRAAQRALLGSAASKTFDGVSVAGAELRDYLTSRGWIPSDGAEIRFQRVLRRGPDIAAVLLQLHGFQVPYTSAYGFAVSELLPLTLRSGAAKIVVNDPWTVTGLKIKISETGYELSFHSD